MRRTNTDYKFNDDNPNTHYLSTHSLKLNYNNEIHNHTNIEFDYYFNHLCRIDDHDICHKTILSNTFESGIGSSISSIDMHCNLSSTTEESSADFLDGEHSDSLLSLGVMANNLCSHFDYHDLPPVTEEEDNDSTGIFNGIENDNKHLDNLPWHDSCITYNSCKHIHSNNNLVDVIKETEFVDNTNLFWNRNKEDNCLLANTIDNGDNHITKPWISDTRDFIPVLSSICHKSEDCILKSKHFLSHLTHTNVISDKAIMYKVFQRRHSVVNGPSIFTYNINSLLTMDTHDDNLSDDEDIHSSFIE